MGEWIYYWRREKNDDDEISVLDKVHWHGPALVVALEKPITADGPDAPATKVAWIAHGSSLMRIILEHLRPEYPSERSRRVEHADHVPEHEDPVSRLPQAVRRAQGPVNYRDLTGQPGPSPPDTDDGPPARRARRGAAAHHLHA